MSAIMKRLAAIIMVLVLAIPAVAVSEEVLSGKCGENMTWKVVGDTLTISGTGYMDNYVLYNLPEPPWHYLEFDHVIIEEGVKTIGRRAFYGENFYTCQLPSTLIQIDIEAFAYTQNLTYIEIPDRVDLISTSNFHGSGLKGIKLPSGIEELAFGLFENCRYLESITIPESVKTIGDHCFYNCTALMSL